MNFLGEGAKLRYRHRSLGAHAAMFPHPLGQETQRAELNEKLYKGQREDEKLYILDNPRVAYRCLSLVCGKK